MSQPAFNQSLMQWAGIYAQSEGTPENDAFRQVHSIIRDMEAQKIAKPIIFYQIMMVLQALTCVMNVQFPEVKIKKILAILYPDDSYVSDLTKQVISAIGISAATLNTNPANAAVLNHLKQGASQQTYQSQRQAPSQAFNAQNVYQNQSQNRQTPKPNGPPPGPYA